MKWILFITLTCFGLIVFGRPVQNIEQQNPLETSVSYTVKPDSLISENSKNIFGNTFSFKFLSDYEEHVFLKIEQNGCKDSCVRLTHELWFKGGNCNSDMEIMTVYEVVKDKLIFYTCDEYVEHMDDRYRHPSTTYIKETYVIRKNGQIVRIKTERGKKNTPMEKEYQDKYAELNWKAN